METLAQQFQEAMAVAYEQGFADGYRQDAEGEDGPRFNNPYRVAR